LATCVKILACIENLQVYKKTDLFTRSNASTTLLKGDKTRLRPKRILVVCEGELTEPSYFKKFKVPNTTIITKGLGIYPTNFS